MLLSTTTDKLQLTTSTAANIDVLTHFADLETATKAVTVDRQLTTISSATTTDIVAAPTSGFKRKVKWASVTNKHASLSNLVTLVYDANATDYVIESATLAPNERLSYSESRGVRVFDSEGREKLPTQPRSDGTSLIAQIAAHSADTYYLGMPIAGRLQAGSFFRWYIVASKGAAGVATPTFIIRTGTAGTVADTARLTMTGPAQSAVADTARIEIFANFRAIGATAVIRGDVQLAHNLAATGFATTGPAGEAHFGGTSASFDVTPANTILGLSVNPGAAGAWVVDQVTLDAVGLLP